MGCSRNVRTAAHPPNRRAAEGQHRNRPGGRSASGSAGSSTPAAGERLLDLSAWELGGVETAAGCCWAPLLVASGGAPPNPGGTPAGGVRAGCWSAAAGAAAGTPAAAAAAADLLSACLAGAEGSRAEMPARATAAAEAAASLAACSCGVSAGCGGAAVALAIAGGLPRRLSGASAGSAGCCTESGAKPCSALASDGK